MRRLVFAALSLAAACGRGLPRDSAAVPDDAGLPQTIDAGSPPQASDDAGSPPPVIAADPPDAGPMPPCDESPDGFDLSVPAEAEKMSCRLNPIPVDPVAPAFDGGVAGPCEEIDNPTTPAARRILRSFDNQGRLLAQVTYDGDGGLLGSTEKIYDSCGDVLWFRTAGQDGDVVQRSHLGSDGLVSRIDSQQGTACTSNSIGYEHDEQGRVSAVLHPNSNISRISVTSGADGRTAMLDYDSFTQVTYRWFADGAMQEDDSQAVSGFFRKRSYDESGHLLDSNGTGTSTADAERDEYSYRDDGQLLTASHAYDNNGCSNRSSGEVRSYTDGLLTHADGTGESGCDGVSWTASTGFTYPEPNVQIAQTTQTNLPGSIVFNSTVRTVFDARGNALTVEQSNPAGSPWVQTLKQSFEGCGAVPP